jgi:hypothetical protein
MYSIADELSKVLHAYTVFAIYAQIPHEFLNVLISFVFQAFYALHWPLRCHELYLAGASWHVIFFFCFF